MIITKTYTIDTTNEIDKLIDRLKSDCENTAGKLLCDLPLDEEEYFKYEDELTKEIFDDIVTRLIFDSKEG